MLWFFFFFKQKTAYEMRISDWSSDVCSSDLTAKLVAASVQQLPAFQGIPRKNFVTKPGMLIAKPGTLQKVASQICGGVYSMQYVTGSTTEPAGGGEADSALLGDDAKAADAPGGGLDRKSVEQGKEVDRRVRMG